jgi:hypothetical protein
LARGGACLASAGAAVVLLAVPVAALGLLRDGSWSEATAGLPTYAQDFFSSQRATGPTPSPTALAQKSFPVLSPTEATQAADQLVRCLRTPDLEVTVEVVPAPHHGNRDPQWAVLTVRLRKKASGAWDNTDRQRDYRLTFTGM